MNLLRLKLLLLALALGLGSCGGDEVVSITPPAPSGPEELYRIALCGSCHGTKGDGGWMGPPIRDLSEHWNIEGLEAFLADPPGVVEADQRLSELSRGFPTPMAKPRLTRDERLRLAAWLLER